MEYNKLATKEVVDKVIAELAKRNVEAIYVGSGKDALAKIKELVLQGASIMNGSSTTLEQIGFIDYLKTQEHGWNNLHQGILDEKDPAKQSILRKQALLSEYYLGSVHALAESGEFIIASNTGSQLSHVVYSSKNPIFVVSTKKIVPTLADTFKRLDEHVMPLENERITKLYGRPTQQNKIVVFKGESAMVGRKVRMILVNEDLGF